MDSFDALFANSKFKKILLKAIAESLFKHVDSHLVEMDVTKEDYKEILKSLSFEINFRLDDRLNKKGRDE